MSVYGDEAVDQLVKIDENHAQLVQSLVTCHKPRQVLELGFGAGEATRAILAGLRYNQSDYAYTVVDNWFDFRGERPPVTREAPYAGINFVTSSERDFFSSCATSYDFIFSDADHVNTQNWMEQVYTHFLSRGGILIYHDVTNTRIFPNLLRIYRDVVASNYHHILFDKNSRAGERCDRGLLVIFKP